MRSEIARTADPETVEASCEKHGTYTAEVTRILGQMIPESCPRCYEEREAKEREYEQRRAEEQKRERIAANKRSCGLPSRFALATFKDYQAATGEQRAVLARARSFAENFAEVAKRGSWLTFTGGPGTGKTHLASAIANRLLEDGVSVLYRRTYDLLREIKSTWSKESELDERAVLEKYTGADLLILDEIGVQFGSETEGVLLFDLLDTRYGNLKPTIVISNLGRADLAELLGERLFDRLAETGSAILAFDWKSHRKGDEPPKATPRGRDQAPPWAECEQGGQSSHARK